MVGEWGSGRGASRYDRIQTQSNSASRPAPTELAEVDELHGLQLPGQALLAALSFPDPPQAQMKQQRPLQRLRAACPQKPAAEPCAVSGMVFAKASRSRDGDGQSRVQANGEIRHSAQYTPNTTPQQFTRPQPRPRLIDLPLATHPLTTNPRDPATKMA